MLQYVGFKYRPSPTRRSGTARYSFMYRHDPLLFLNRWFALYTYTPRSPRQLHQEERDGGYAERDGLVGEMQ